MSKRAYGAPHGPREGRHDLNLVDDQTNRLAHPLHGEQELFDLRLALLGSQLRL